MSVRVCQTLYNATGRHKQSWAFAGIGPNEYLDAAGVGRRVSDLPVGTSAQACI